MAIDRWNTSVARANGGAPVSGAIGPGQYATTQSNTSPSTPSFGAPRVTPEQRHATTRLPAGNSGRYVYMGDQAYGYDVAPVRTAKEISNLMGGYNYNEAAIRALFDKATKAEYAAKRAANAGAQRQFATNTGSFINTLSDTMRQQLNQAVATGGSRGLAAAQAMQAAQNASLQTVDEATKLTEDAMALDFEEAAAYAQNAKDAEALRATRQNNLMNIAAGLYDIDERTTVGAMSAAAQYASGKAYGADAAGYNLDGTIYNADKNSETQLGVAGINKETEELVARLQSDDNLRALVMNGINSGTVTPSEEIAKILGIPLEQLKAPTPQADYTNRVVSSGRSYGGSNGSYYSGGGYSGRGYSGGGGYSSDSSSGSDIQSQLDEAKTTVAAANTMKKQGVLNENYDTYLTGALALKIPEEKARQDYTDAKNQIWHWANNMSFKDFETRMRQTYGATRDQAYKFYFPYREQGGKGK